MTTSGFVGSQQNISKGWALIAGNSPYAPRNINAVSEDELRWSHAGRCP